MFDQYHWMFVHLFHAWILSLFFHAADVEQQMLNYLGSLCSRLEHANLSSSRTCSLKWFRFRSAQKLFQYPAGGLTIFHLSTRSQGCSCIVCIFPKILLSCRIHAGWKDFWYAIDLNRHRRILCEPISQLFKPEYPPISRLIVPFPPG